MFTSIYVYDKNNEQIGEALIYEMSLPNEPKEFDIKSMKIKTGNRGKGKGTKLLKKINDFIEKQNGTGFLTNGIRESNPAHLIYLHNGWTQFSKDLQKLKYESLKQ